MKISHDLNYLRSLLIGFAVTLSIVNYQHQARSQDTEQFKPPPELERLEYFEGTWRCQQPAAPESPVGVFMWTVQRDLNNFWYVGNAEEIELSEDREPINSREFLGYDTVSQKLLRYVVVGNGNSFNFSALDWQDEVLVWEGAVVENGEIRALREEIVRENSDRFTATYFMLDEADEWQPVVDETCDRVESN